MTTNETEVARQQPCADLDAVFDALAHPYRRSVLQSLDRESPRGLDELAERIAEIRETASEDRVEIALVHQHLPRMADAGLVTYDDDVRECALAEASTALALVETAHERI